MKKRNIVGIDIGKGTLKLVHMNLSGAKPRLLSAELEEIHDVKEDEVVGVIKKALLNFFRTIGQKSDVYIILDEPIVTVKRVDLPRIPEGEILSALKWKLKDRVGFDVEDSIIDYSITEEYKTNDGIDQLCVMVAVAPRSEIMKVLGIFNELNLNVTGINTTPFCLSKILSDYEDVTPNETVAILDIGHEGTIVSIYKSNRLVFTRGIAVGSFHITDAMCAVLVSDKGRVELTCTEAEELKRTCGIPRIDYEIPNLKATGFQILSLVRPVLEQLALEIRRTFDYYTTELNGKMPNRIYLVGGGSKLTGLDRFLSDELKIETQYMRLPSVIENSTGLGEKDLAPFLGVIGATLLDKPNLIPMEYRFKKKKRVEWATIRMIILFTSVFLITSYIFTNIRVNIYKKQIEMAQGYGEIINKYISMLNEINRRSQIISKIKETEIPSVPILKVISNVIPSNIVLNELSFSQDSGVLHLKGILYINNTVPEEDLTSFMEALENSGFIKDATLVSLTRSEIEGKSIVSFEMECVL